MLIDKTYVDLHDIVDVFCENICSIEGFIVEILNSASIQVQDSLSSI